jgi:hypothetical protein
MKGGADLTDLMSGQMTDIFKKPQKTYSSITDGKFSRSIFHKVNFKIQNKNA